MTNNDPPENKPLGPSAADVPLNELPTVTLTDEQLQEAQQIAKARNESYGNIDGGRVCGEQTSADVHTTGVIGELIYATQYDAQIDDSVYSYGDDGYDFVSGPLTVDIKTTGTHVDRPIVGTSTSGVNPNPADQREGKRSGQLTVQRTDTALYD